jgi:hypothetical protein
MALAHSNIPRIVYMDFDHLLRWIENNPSELDRILEATAEYDCAVIGRGPKSLAALPERLATPVQGPRALGRVHGGRGHDLPHQRRLRL